MSHVDFKKWQCRTSLKKKKKKEAMSHVITLDFYPPYRMLLGSMAHVEFKKC